MSKYIFDEDSANEAYFDRQPQEREESKTLWVASELLHKIFPNCDIDIHAKLALPDLSEDLVF